MSRMVEESMYRLSKTARQSASTTRNALDWTGVAAMPLLNATWLDLGRRPKAIKASPTISSTGIVQVNSFYAHLYGNEEYRLITDVEKV